LHNPFAPNNNYFQAIENAKELSMEEFESPVRIAIFASGKGSNTQSIIDYFRNDKRVQIALIASNNPQAGVLEIARTEKIDHLIVEKEKFIRGNAYTDELREKRIDRIVLAGFLWKLPAQLILRYPEKIINIHPALLPKYGGRGMYGHHVHEAVIRDKETKSGITIHFVDELYDHGKIIFQVSCPVNSNDTPGTLAKKIQGLEHAYFPKVIEEWMGMQNIVKR
jgi:phosphoribosylglycinamide formyltransferase 1